MRETKRLLFSHGTYVIFYHTCIKNSCFLPSLTGSDAEAQEAYNDETYVDLYTEELEIAEMWNEFEQCEAACLNKFVSISKRADKMYNPEEVLTMYQETLFWSEDLIIHLAQIASERPLFLAFDEYAEEMKMRQTQILALKMLLFWGI